MKTTILIIALIQFSVYLQEQERLQHKFGHLHYLNKTPTFVVLLIQTSISVLSVVVVSESYVRTIKYKRRKKHTSTAGGKLGLLIFGGTGGAVDS